MKKAIIILALLLTTACSSVPRNKFTDKSLRVMVEPTSIHETMYPRVVQAVVNNGKFRVVDRAKGYKAIKAEQERLHINEASRYSNPQKWAHWGKMYGVGAVIVPEAICQEKRGLFNKKYVRCVQHLRIIDANTGEIIATAENEASGDSGEWAIAPAWDEAVEKLTDAYPEYFVPNQDHEILDNYKAVSEEHANRQASK